MSSLWWNFPRLSPLSPPEIRPLDRLPGSPPSEARDANAPYHALTKTPLRVFTKKIVGYVSWRNSARGLGPEGSMEA